MKAVAGRWKWCATAAIGLLLFTGCNGGTPDGSSLTPIGEPTPPGTGIRTRTPPAPSSTSSVNRADLLTVYRTWWRVVTEAFARGDADHPDLAIYGSDPILSRERNQIRALRAEGIVQRTQLTLAPRVLNQSELVAEIADCIRGPANTYVDLMTGRPRAPRGYRNDVPTKDSLLISLHKRGGYWVVVAATSEGVQAC